MNLEAIVVAVSKDLARMDKVYRRPVFDEWAVVEFQPDRDAVLYYHGPRAETIRDDLADDLTALRGELHKGSHSAGQFEFSRDAAGTTVDAFIALGRKTYLIFNHTSKTMREITADPLWTAAQLHFVNLSERLANEPLHC